MQIIQQLQAGTTHFQVQPDGSEQLVTRAPTSLNLQASRALEELLQVLQGLERANQTLQQQLNQTQQELDAQRSLLQKFMADAQQSGSGTVPEHTEAAEPAGAVDVAKETKSASTST